MSSKTYCLFISYRTTDSAQVDRIAQNLRLLKYEDGTPRYAPWQDKRDLPAGVPNWWDAILNAIETSDLFVFHLTLESLKSEVCWAELDYAYRLNLPIIIVVLDSAYDLIPASGSYRLHDEIQSLLPSWLEKTQWLFYTGAAEFFPRFETAVNYHERQWPLRTSAKRPLHPSSDHTHGDPYALYDDACERAYKLDFRAAEDLFRELMRRNIPRFADIAAQWLQLLQLYDELILIAARPRTRFLFMEKWEVYLKLFPKDFLEDRELFDPKSFKTRNDSKIDPLSPIITPVPITSPITPTPQLEANLADLLPTTVIKPRSQDLMPDPFAWVEIPNKGYHIAKYPVTNEQYALFVADDGYEEQDWWTGQGWKTRQKKNWTASRYWQKSPWKIPDHPVVGISWYEAIAFCLWLSDRTAEKILLPSEEQWQYAAQGDDERAYPWGDVWDCKRCNNSVDPCKGEFNTSVLQYEGKGDSPFGVIDMAGNVWEWCLTDYYNRENNIDGSEGRVLRGGAWININSSLFRCDCRNWVFPYNGSDFRGFRLVRA